MALEVIWLLLQLPLGAVLRYVKEQHINIPDWGDVLIIIYLGCSASLVLYLEVLFVAELYLWHLRREKAQREAVETRQPIPELRHIPKPSLLDEVPDLTRALS